MIRENDKVVLTVALSDHGLEPGDVGGRRSHISQAGSLRDRVCNALWANRRDRHCFSQLN
jgi:hypothetical protein